MSESLFCAIFDISFSLFCRKSVQSWMRRFWAKNAEETTYGAYDGPSPMWRSVGGSVEKLLKEDGEVRPSVGLRRLWRSVVAMTVRPAGSSWRSEKWSQYPDSKSWSILKRDPRRTVVPMTVRHTCRRGEWRKQQNKLHQVWDDRVHDGPLRPRRSVAWSVDPAAFWQISSN